MDTLTPAAVVAELDRYIVGQREAKRAVAIALRNRMRRQRLADDLRDEVSPKNILMIGPTGVGKTEIARRVARIVDAPFVKVEATKFTEVGYVGRDVESIVRDLVEVGIGALHEARLAEVRPEAERAATEKLVTYLLRQREAAEAPAAPRPTRRARRGEAAGTGEPASPGSARRLQRRRQRLLAQVQGRQLEDVTVEIEVEARDDEAGPLLDFLDDLEPEELGEGGRELLDALGGARRRSRRVSVRDARRILTEQEAARLVDVDDVIDEAIRRVEESGVVFLDEVDKLVSDGGEYGPGVSSEGVQRDLLPIVEGSTVLTRYGPVKTDHILFIGAGAFTDVKPADLIPEFQGRFPLRVELAPLNEDDLYAILTEPANALTRQYVALLATEGVTLTFADDGLREIAAVAARLNERQEDIGARRLATIVEQVLEEISFDAPARAGETVVIDAAYVRERVGDIAEDEDLSNFIL
jgi:ATP-dependent HslUV protease ATP-binding subunit HslU